MNILKKIASHAATGMVVILFAPVMVSAADLVTTNEIANNAINTYKLATGAVKSSDIRDGEVMNPDLANNSVNTYKIATGSVRTSDIQDGTITSEDLGDITFLSVGFLTANSILSTNIFNSDYLNLGNGSTTDIADNGGGTPASHTLSSTGATARVVFNCLDTDGCNVTMGEDFVDGDILFISNEGTNVVNFADTPGVSELAGAFAMGQWDTLHLMFRDNGSTGSWVEVSRSNN